MIMPRIRRIQGRKCERWVKWHGRGDAACQQDRSNRDSIFHFVLRASQTEYDSLPSFHPSTRTRSLAIVCASWLNNGNMFCSLSEYWGYFSTFIDNVRFTGVYLVRSRAVRGTVILFWELMVRPGLLWLSAGREGAAMEISADRIILNRSWGSCCYIGWLDNHSVKRKDVILCEKMKIKTRHE